MPRVSLIDPRAHAQQIADHYTAAIRTGHLTPGTQLPAATTLRTEWHVSGETIRDALNLLRAAGLVISRQGVGSFVTDWQPQTSTLDTPAGDHLSTQEPTRRDLERCGTEYAAEVLVLVREHSDGRVLSRTVTSDHADVHGIDHTRDVLTTRLLTRDDAHAMQLPIGTPVLVQQHTGYDRHGTAVRYVETIHNGPMTELMIDRTA